MSSSGYYLCARTTGAKRRLSRLRAPNDTSFTLDHFRISGRFLAYERARSESDGRDSTPTRAIVVRDSRTGALVRQLSAGQSRGFAFAEPLSGDGVSDIELSSKGDLAWIVRNPGGRAVPEPNVNTSSRITEVYGAPRTGSLVLLAQSDAIKKRSLRRRGCTVAWTNNAAQESASICP